MKFWISILALVLTFASVSAEAARLGGGRSIGRQSSNVTQRQMAPAQGAVRPTAPVPTTPAVPAPKRPWGAMLGGLAAGLGLAWLRLTGNIGYCEFGIQWCRRLRGVVELDGPRG